MTDSLGSMMEALRPHPSSLRKQVEARHESAAEFSFYGPAGSDFGQTTCKPRTKDSGHFSPGPARYNYLSMTPERVRRAASVVARVCVLGDAVDRLFPLPRSCRRSRGPRATSSRSARPGTTSRSRASTSIAPSSRTGASSGAPGRPAVRAPDPPRARAETARARVAGRRPGTSTRPTSKQSSSSTSTRAATSASRRRPGPSSTPSRTPARARSGSGSGATTRPRRSDDWAGEGPTPPRGQRVRGPRA